MRLALNASTLGWSITSAGMGFVVEVVRALTTHCKSKIGVVSGVISSTGSESAKSERSLLLQTPLTTPSL